MARLHAPGGFGQTLFGELEALLARRHVRLADIDLYAAATGPWFFDWRSRRPCRHQRPR